VCVGVRGCVFWVAHPLPIAAVAVLMTPGVGPVLQVIRLAVTAPVACSPVCGGLRLWWSTSSPSPRWSHQ